MAGFSSPGVYRREIDLSEILVSTGISNGGIVIRSQQGPVRRPVLISNGKEFVETFGTPYYVSGGSTANGIGGKLVPELGYGAYGALEFLKESNTLFVVRAYTNTGPDIKDRYAAVGVGVSGTYINVSGANNAVGIEILPTTPDVFDSSTKISTYDEYADNDMAANVKLLVGFVGPGELGNNYAVTVETINPTCDWLFNYDNFPADASATTKAVTATDPDGNIVNIAAIWTATSGGPSTVYKYFPNASEVVKIQVFAKPDDKQWEELYSNSTDKNEFKLRNEPLEVFYGSMRPMMDLDGNEMFIEKQINGVSKLIYVKAGSGFATGTAPDASWTWNAVSGASVPSSSFKLPDGIDTAGFYVLNNDRLSKLVGGDVDYKTGLDGSDSDFWQYFENRDEVPVSILINHSANQTDKVAVGNLCNQRKDAIATNQVGWVNTLDWQSVLNSEPYGYPAPSFMSLYSGYSKVYDQYNDKFVYLPNSIFAAAVFARVDNNSYPWFAPAGVARATMGVLDQNKIFSTTDIGRMYDRNINSVKLVQGAGFVLWGQKTAQLKTTALDRINVRRNLIFIELNIERGLQQFVFENNTQQTRLRVFSLVDEFLAGIQASDGLYGYDVVCDETNNPPSVIDANQLNVDIYVQPVKTAEFIQFTTVVTRTGVSFSDVRLKYA